MVSQPSDRSAQTQRGQRHQSAALVAREQQFDHRLDRRRPDQRLVDDLIVAHAKMRIRTEIDWHEQVLANIGKLETR